ncbi:MAG: Two-component system sensor histidine kinase [candidate division TM6 bacterium GW2011_GWF2_33_332]|nr:MAG: Two-component system sensor histidine kinase [candidate division TM6 bacterium GW2011_GWF2_33_332]
MIMGKNKSVLIKGVVIVSIIILGLLFLNYNWQKISNEHSKVILQNANSIGNMFRIDEIMALDANINDTNKTQYQVIKNILKEIIKINPDARFAYIYIERNGKIFFIADSEEENSNDYSPPGQEYTEAKDEDIQPFKDGKVTLTSPLTDRWGTWISALIPLKDENGKVIAVFGMDFNSESWNNQILYELFESSLLFFLWLFAAVLIIVIISKNKALNNKIKEKKIVDEELTKSNRKLSTLMANLPGMVYFCLIDDNWTMKYVSEGTIELTEFHPDELIDNKITCFNKLIHPEDQIKVHSNVLNAIKKEVPFEIEYRIITKSGIIKHVWERGQMIKSSSDGLEHLEGFITDISERKRIENILKQKTEEIDIQNKEYKQINIDLTKAKEKAEENDQLKTAFLLNLSHEIRTPMNAIIGFSDLLNRPDLTEEQKKRFIPIIKDSSHQLLSVVSDILTISLLETKQEKTKYSNFCVNNVMDELDEIYKQNTVKKNISIVKLYHLSNLQSTIYSDKTKIIQILSNLLNNAVKFTKEGIIEFGYNLIGDELVFFVKDSGIGIENEQKEKIFERFQQANLEIASKYGGTGLGLSISKGFVEMLGGRIWVESELGKGSTFFFTIPYILSENDKKEVFYGSALNELKTILVAEDEDINYFFIFEILRDLNLNIIHAKDGVEAVKICKENKEINLVLMDLKMPNMGGDEAAEIIKKFRPELPIIAQSAYLFKNSNDKYNMNCFDDYIAKPIDIDELKQKIIRYL